ncbi:winged helix-turn-helix transcriptional regulator [Jannaschia sp. R86511]|uniref:winged helix-turn-helix transcriptional regulator n=1 Tax=Jannaschia sp. R86511 TaxID=3093853 RepID=UPI0036D24EBA
MTTATTETKAKVARSMAWSTANCSVARTLAVVGEKWTFQVLREVFLGVRRFEDMHLHGGIPRQVLSKQLGSLVDADLLVRVPYREDGARERHEYRLTDAGAALRIPLMALMAWGDEHLADTSGPAVHVVHRGCGELVQLVAGCAADHPTPELIDLRFVPGPGAQPSGLA